MSGSRRSFFRHTHNDRYTDMTTANKKMIRFDLYITREQHDFLKRLAKKTGISGGYAIRKGLSLYARKQGINLPAENNQ